MAPFSRSPVRACLRKRSRSAFARGNQYLNDAGVYFRQYGQDGANEREWPLSHIPVIISQDDWQVISEGLVQRAELLEQVVADLYGPNTLVADGLPAGQPDRPEPGMAASRWWASNRNPDTSCISWPSRSAAARMAPGGCCPTAPRRRPAPVSRWKTGWPPAASSTSFSPAPTCIAWPASSAASAITFVELRAEPDSRVSILTPGPLNDTYFEHAYIARYLGFMLLEGEDLTVENGRLMVRTVAGLKPVSVLWRRLDAAWADPVELNETSQIGTPGLVQAVRSGSVTMINALGTGILETRALLAFLPRISEHLLGEPLKLPNVATWWCGEALTRDYVKEHAETMMFSPALSTALPFASAQTDFIGRDFHKLNQGILDSWIDSKAGGLVGQEAVTLSTTPAYHDGQLAAAAHEPCGCSWPAPPWLGSHVGGVCPHRPHRRRQRDRHAVRRLCRRCLDHGRPEAGQGHTAAPDGIAVFQVPERRPALACRRQPVLARPLRGTRGRRGPAVARLSRTAAGNRRPEAPLVAQTAEFLDKIGVAPSEPVPEGLCDMLQSAVASAAKVRDRFSVDGWLALNDLAQTANGAKSAPCAKAPTSPAPWVCFCARSPAFPDWCMKTCTGSPAGAFSASAGRWNAPTAWRTCSPSSPRKMPRKAPWNCCWKSATAPCR